jgi:hypothetical protein
MKMATAGLLAAVALVVSACSASAGVTPVRAGGTVDAEAQNEPVGIPFEPGTAWDQQRSMLGLEFRKVLPGSEVFSPLWYFDRAKSITAEPAALTESCVDDVVERPKGVVVNFALGRRFDAELYREGEVRLTVLTDDDPTVIAAYAASRASSVDCLADQLSDDISVVPVETGLPDHAVVAFNLAYERTGPDDDGIERSAAITVIELQHGDTFVAVRMSAIQPVTHPEWIDIEREALRIASAIDFST